MGSKTRPRAASATENPSPAKAARQGKKTRPTPTPETPAAEAAARSLIRTTKKAIALAKKRKTEHDKRVAAGGKRRDDTNTGTPRPRRSVSPREYASGTGIVIEPVEVVAPPEGALLDDPSRTGLSDPAALVAYLRDGQTYSAVKPDKGSYMATPSLTKPRRLHYSRFTNARLEAAWLLRKQELEEELGRTVSCHEVMPAPGRFGFATDDMWDDLLVELARIPNRARALRISGVAGGSLYERIKRDEEFAALYHEALQRGWDSAEDEAVRRGMEGVDEPVFWEGQQIGNIRRYSDRLLEMLLRGNKDKYREKVISGLGVISDETQKALGDIFKEAAALGVLPAPATGEGNA